MFFSVIIPTYNPREYLPRLLSSIARNDCVNDIEIIISDDCSDEPFDDVLESFSSLNIQKISNEEHSGFPRNGRQHGAEVATGQWICFADQDDYYVDHGLDKIKTHITEHNIHNYLATNFIVYTESNNEYIMISARQAWTHGKFYEKSFWDKYQICFDNVQYCEDINLSTKVGCITTTENIDIITLDDPVYVWHKRSDSLSNMDNYFLNSMIDYVMGTLGVIIDYMEKFKYNETVVDKLSVHFVNTIYHIYFYFQSEDLNIDRKAILETALNIYPIYEQFKKLTKLTTEKILEKTKSDFNSLFAETRNEDCRQVPFFEKMTFEQWVKAYLN